MNQLSCTEIAPRIYWVRNQKVMLDRDLAGLYGIQTKVLKQAVRRNSQRFPSDFMFQLSQEELMIWRSQFVTSKQDRKGLRYSPMAFTEQGVAMLSSVLRSPQAIQVNIAIMRTFVQLRQLMDVNRDLKKQIESLENKYDEQFSIVFEAIKQLVVLESEKTERIRRKAGFHP